MHSDHDEVASTLSQTREGSVFVLTSDHRERCLARLDPSAFDGAVLRRYYEEFNETASLVAVRTHRIIWSFGHPGVAGSSFGGVKGRTQVPQFVERWLAGEIDVESLVSHRITLDEVNRGFELMEAQDGIRSVIAFA